MTIKCTECPLRDAECFIPFTDDELRFMLRFKVGELVIEPKTTILLEGSSAPKLYTVLDGMGLRYKILPDGRRQVLNFIYPGDFIGLQAGLLGEMKHSADATTKMTLCVFERRDLGSLFKSNADRAYDITWLAAVEEHFLGSSISTIGQRDARARMAWALVRIYYRSRSVGFADGQRVTFPFKQQDLADTLGLSLVHTNKTLAKFRAAGLVSWVDGVLTYTNLAELETIAMTEASEHLEPRPLM